jgi:hypothetical protein
MAISQGLPTRTADSTAIATPSRADNYGGAIVQPLSGKEFGAVAEGSYFVGITPTPGTGVIGHAAPTTFDEAKAYIVLYNSSSTVSLYPQFLQLHNTVVSVGDTRVQFTICVDSGNRYSSAGTSLTVNNCNMNSSIATVATTAKIGAVVSTAASGARRVLGNIVFRGTIDVVEDTYEIVFGGTGGGSSTGSRVATVMDASRTAPPICVGPGQSLLIHQWAGSQSTGPTFEAIFGWIER